MSYLPLQRLVVRMLYDPEFAGQLLDAVSRVEVAGGRSAPDPAATRSLEFGSTIDSIVETLSVTERAWLLKPDRRAWDIDPDRPVRSLAILRQEFPASVALIESEAGGNEKLREFFRSERFHGAVQDRGSMAMAFADHIVDLSDAGASAGARIGAILQIERAIARLRRDAARAHPAATRATASTEEPDLYHLSADRALLVGVSGAAEARSSILGRIDEGMRAERQIDVGMEIETESYIDPRESEQLLLELDRAEESPSGHLVGVTEITEELYRLLDFARTPRSQTELSDELVRLGAAEEETTELIWEWIGEGTLVPSR